MYEPSDARDTNPAQGAVHIQGPITSRGPPLKRHHRPTTLAVEMSFTNVGSHRRREKAIDRKASSQPIPNQCGAEVHPRARDSNHPPNSRGKGCLQEAPAPLVVRSGETARRAILRIASGSFQFRKPRRTSEPVMKKNSTPAPNSEESSRSTSTVKHVPSHRGSISETAYRRLPWTARRVMASRSSAQTASPPTRAGWAAGTKRRRSRPRLAVARSARARCPLWTGLKVPPRMPSLFTAALSSRSGAAPELPR